MIPEFNALIPQILWSKLPVRERLPIRKIWFRSYQGLNLCRARRMDESAALFHLCWELVAHGGLSIQGELLARTFLESSQAYFEHRRGDFDMARTRTRNTMEADLQLEADADFSLLEMHRVQSANNLMRIDLRAGEPRRALALAGQILAYLEGFRDELPVHRSWRSDLIRARTPRPMRRDMISQVANEAALALRHFPDLGLERELLANVRIESYRGAARVIHPRLRLWLLALRARQEQDWERYFEALIEFLPMGHVGIHPLWYSAMIDLVRRCRELDSRVSMLIHDGILCDARRWRWVPAAFRPLLDLDADGGGEAPPPHVQAAGFGAPRPL